ncbi:site-specific integrase [Nitratireductor sp. ac15]
MATIRKRGNKWQVQVRRKGVPPQNKSFSTRKDAEQWARKIESNIDLGRHIDMSALNDLTLGALLERYGREITPSKKGRDAEERRLARLQRDRIATTPLAALDAPTLCKFRDRRNKDGLRASQYDLVLIRHAIEIARKEWGLSLASNPVDQIRIPMGIKSRNRRLEQGEFEALREAARYSRSPYLWPAIELAIETAMRRSELLSLNWHNIDLDNSLAFLPDTKNGHPRQVPLTPTANAILSRLPRRTERVLPTTDTAIRQAWDRLVERAGISDLRFHDLRHEAVSRFFERGLNVAEVALISGHRDPRMLFRYTHLKSQDVAQKLCALSGE